MKVLKIIIFEFSSWRKYSENCFKLEKIFKKLKNKKKKFTSDNHVGHSWVVSFNRCIQIPNVSLSGNGWASSASELSASVSEVLWDCEVNSQSKESGWERNFQVVVNFLWDEVSFGNQLASASDGASDVSTVCWWDVHWGENSGTWSPESESTVDSQEQSDGDEDEFVHFVHFLTLFQRNSQEQLTVELSLWNFYRRTSKRRIKLFLVDLLNSLR